MIDFGTILFTAGVQLVGSLLFKWISEGKSTVKVSAVDRQIAIEAAAEAERLRLRPDDLEQAAQRALQEIVARSPQLSFARSSFHSNLRLEFDPKDGDSSKQLLLDLRRRLDELAHQAEVGDPRPALNLPPGAILVTPGRPGEGGTPAVDPPRVLAQPTRAKRLLDDLKARVDQIETDRE